VSSIEEVNVIDKRWVVLALVLMLEACAGTGSTWQPNGMPPSGGAPYTAPCNATG
jgi:hypothetical protein